MRYKTPFTISNLGILGGVFSILLLFSACKPEEMKIGFPHKAHIQQEIGCEACHDLKDTEVSRPTIETCLSCHDANAKEFESCNECHTQVGKKELKKEEIVSHLTWFKPNISKGWVDVKFQHKKYVKEESNCLGCHPRIKEAEFSSIKNLPVMEEAMAAAKKLGYPNQCEICHQQVNQITQPASHDLRWITNHGRMSEFKDKSRCLLCHQEEICITCHTQMKPKDHNNLWRRRTHGIQASFDRSRCIVCHQEDQCAACHRATANPIPPTPFHTPDASCLTCHSPLAAQGPQPRPPQQFFKPMPHRMMMGVTSQKCLECHMF